VVPLSHFRRSGRGKVDFEHIGKYRVVSKIGQGAMGQVFKAHDPVLNRYVAIKTMSVVLGTDEELRRRFQREAQSAARLNHPKIITVYEFGEEQGNAYLAMELLEGTDLKDLIGTRALTTIEEKLDLMEQICEGLAFAHSMEVVHRDLKPANIHIQPGGQVKIMDFGLARLGSSNMTKSGMVMGTPNYMSPEQVRGEKADSRSDIFSLGAVFYELLTNHKPFNADSMHAVLYQVLQTDPDPPRKWVPDLSPALVELVERALSKVPEERFQNGSEMLEAVREARHGYGVGRSGVRVVDQTTLDAPGSAEETEIGPSPRPRSISMRRRGREGSAALDLSTSATPSRTAAPAMPRTLSGRAPTHVDGSAASSAPPTTFSPPTTISRPPTGAPPWRVPVLAGSAVVAAGALAFGAWLLTRGEGKVDGKDRPARNQVSALTQQLVGSQVQLARKQLEDKDYRAAVTQAEGALKLDPASAEAREVLDRARAILDELDASASEARSAFEAGDPERASKALAKVLALDPNHPSAVELSARLNTQFRSQAEDARQAARRAQGAAEHARARSAEGFAEGLSLAREGDAAFKRSEFAVAARKFLDSRDSFDHARRSVEEKAVARAAPPPAVVPPPASLTPSTTVPPATLAVPTPPPTTLPAATLPPPTLPPTTVATLPVTSAPPITSPVADDVAIRKLVADYARAIEEKNLALFRTVKPNLSNDEEQRLQAAFQASATQRVSISIVGIQISGPQATVRVNRRDSVDGHTVATQQTLTLARGPGGWTIREIGR
jgi:eukaryotic-like serine/threonine-protein kinase